MMEQVEAEGLERTGKTLQANPSLENLKLGVEDPKSITDLAARELATINQFTAAILANEFSKASEIIAATEGLLGVERTTILGRIAGRVPELGSIVKELLSNACRRNSQGSYTAIVEKLIDAYNALPNENWGHCIADSVGEFLDHSANWPATKRFVNEAVRRAIADPNNRTNMCMDRLVGGLVYHQERQGSFRDREFVFKPKSLENSEFLATEHVQRFRQACRNFCQAATPEEYILLEVAGGSFPKSNDSLEEKLLFLGQKSSQLSKEIRELILKDLFGVKELEENFRTSLKLILDGNLSNLSFKELAERARISDCAQGFEEGVFVDFSGTLYSCVVEAGKVSPNSYGPNTDGTLLNQKLHSQLIELLDSGRRVVVFTEEDPNQATDLLRELAADPRLLPVVSKIPYRGRNLEILVSNCPKELQGLGALYQAQFWLKSALADSKLGERVEMRCSKLAQAASRIEEPGVFVDCENTLYTHYYFNQELASKLAEIQRYGKKVVIFTGGNPEEATAILAQNGVARDLLPVHSKNNYQGRMLEILIDDTRAVNQGLTAMVELHPFGDKTLLFSLLDHITPHHKK